MSRDWTTIPFSKIEQTQSAGKDKLKSYKSLGDGGFWVSQIVSSVVPQISIAGCRLHNAEYRLHNAHNQSSKHHSWLLVTPPLLPLLALMNETLNGLRQHPPKTQEVGWMKCEWNVSISQWDIAGSTQSSKDGDESSKEGISYWRRGCN